MQKNYRNSIFLQSNLKELHSILKSKKHRFENKMNLNFNFESRENHFLISGISHPRWYLSPRFTVPVSDFLTVLKKYSVLILGSCNFFYNRSYRTFGKAQIIDSIKTQCQISLIHDYSY